MAIVHGWQDTPFGEPADYVIGRGCTDNRTGKIQEDNRDSPNNQLTRSATMNLPQDADRRTVLKTIGGGAVGGMVMTGSATAHDAPTVQRVWANGAEYEMLGTEPFASPGGLNQDAEGDEEAHSPLYIIAPTRDKPQRAGHVNFPTCHDHVVPLEGGGEFSAQWHVQLVVDPTNHGSLRRPNLVNEDADGTCLTSASAVESAAAAGDVDIVPHPVVFTCPVRPLKGNHPLPSCTGGNVDPGSNC